MLSGSSSIKPSGDAAQWQLSQFYAGCQLSWQCPKELKRLFMDMSCLVVLQESHESVGFMFMSPLLVHLLAGSAC